LRQQQLWLTLSKGSRCLVKFMLLAYDATYSASWCTQEKRSWVACMNDRSGISARMAVVVGVMCICMDKFLHGAGSDTHECYPRVQTACAQQLSACSHIDEFQARVPIYTRCTDAQHLAYKHAIHAGPQGSWDAGELQRRNILKYTKTTTQTSKIIQIFARTGKKGTDLASNKLSHGEMETRLRQGNKAGASQV